MLELEHNQDTLSIATNWQEITFQNYVDMLKVYRLLPLPQNGEDDLFHYARMVKLIAATSTDPEKCERWLRKMHTTEFEELNNSLEFEDLTTVKSSDATHVSIDGRTYRIRKNMDFTMGEMTHFETLKGRFKDQEDHLLAFGLLLQEEIQGELQDFTAEQFDFVVNNLPTKVKYIDVFKHLDFFLHGGSESSTTTTPSFSIRRQDTTRVE